MLDIKGKALSYLDICSIQRDNTLRNVFEIGTSVSPIHFLLSVDVTFCLHFIIFALVARKKEFGMDEKLNGIFAHLDITGKTGLASEDNYSELTAFQELFYNQAKSKIGIDAVYFLRDEEGVAKIPLIYFSILEDDNVANAAKLHSLSWNMGEAPLLFVVTPTELRIYNNYLTPKKKDGSLDPEAGLIDTISLLTDLETQRRELAPYNRILLESGEYWRLAEDRFNINTRIDTTLMNNLRVMRRRLITRIRTRANCSHVSAENIVSIVHGLLSRSILIKYLEERKDSNGESVFPKDFYAQFSFGSTICNQYTDVLGNKEATYKLFSVLESKFNGDMLPLIQNEREIITEDDLEELKSFLLGNSDLESQQMTLWPLYDFNIIPIKIISSIYELFFHLSDVGDDDKGTYYTPLHLVDTLLDEAYPWEGEFKPISIIDPSCGSGIFLVEVYRRIVCRWMRSNGVSQITNKQLTAILKECIYGVDLNEEAVRVASFSLSLALCDFLDPRSIWNELSFPKLVNTNLIVSDFFDNTLDDRLTKYDVVIGNPPWQSQLTQKAVEYIKKNNYVVGDKQIAQAFSIKCAMICKETGVVCLLMPSKGLLFNRSTQSSIYRKRLFEENAVSVIINFSIYRRVLFDNATAPCTAIIYYPQKPANNDSSIFYCTPKPHYSLQDTKKFSIDPTDICRIPNDLVCDDRIWKIAMWGSPRDLELIDKMQSTYPSLDEFLANHNMQSAEGFKRGNRKLFYDGFANLPIVDAKAFYPFYMQEELLWNNNDNTFERISNKNLSIFKAPHLVMKQSHRKGRFLAAVLDYDAIFNHSLLGFSGEERMLKYLCLIINSKLFSYYHLLTSRTWMVERDALEAGDIRTIPIPEPSEEILSKAVEIYEHIKQSGDESVMDPFVYEVYKLKDYETYLVSDALGYIYDYFAKKADSVALKKPSIDVYQKYYSTLMDVLKNSLGQAFTPEASFYIGESPLSILALSISGNNGGNLTFFDSNESTERCLSQLDSLLTEERHNIYIRRNVRVYGNDAIYIVKPKQEKYWNYSSACRDADELFSDIMNAKG